MVITTPARRRRRQKTRFVLLCLAPALVLYLLFMILPTFDVLRMSLYNWTGVGGTPTFAGIDNFVALLDDMQFVRAFQNTIFLLVIVSVITMVVGLALAAVMTQGRIRGSSLYRFVLYLPSILSIVVVAAIFSAVYDQQNGLINGTLKLLGVGGAPVWLGDQKLVVVSVALAMVWQSLGYYLVLYMSGMSNIPAELYEASALDGAGPVRQFFDITLPLVWETIRTSLVFFVISSVNLAFVLVRALTDGGPAGSSEVLLDYMYRQAFTNSSYGYGMAIGTVIFAFSFAAALVLSKVTKREVLQF